MYLMIAGLILPPATTPTPRVIVRVHAYKPRIFVRSSVSAAVIVSIYLCHRPNNTILAVS